MKKNEAAQLVDQTFSNEFSEEKFVSFVRNLLLDLMPPSTRTVSGGQIPEGYKDHVRSITRLGTLIDPQGDVLDVVVVKLKRKGSLDRARTQQRNLMAHYLNKRKKDAVLVAYITDDPADWRFSFVKLAYKTEVTEEGKVNVKSEFTPARRYSFLVGENEPNHTAQKQLGDLLMQEGKLTLAQIEEAFNIESVTKEFFEKYKGLFIQIKENLDQIVDTNQQVKAEFETREIDTANFAKKLLGQIVFLYFIQKKGWLGVAKDEAWGTGDKKFLHTLFQGKEDRNYFDDILEPFFYKALAYERNGDYYSALKCKVPFLNGGLFEPLHGYDWKKLPINLDNNIFEGIFETFNLYNFTVREDEPLEREVAVDPEMLGKVFENLLEITDRKSKGAYYTPREIVHYMCQESLINYLDTTLNTESQKVAKGDIESFIREGDTSVERDQAREDGKLKGGKYGLPEKIREHAKEIDFALADVKICDPAIGSGAFPVGMMTEIVRARDVLTTHLKTKQPRDAYTFKWHCIENSLYGVDIDVGAVEIAKLRLWLSLVVDEESYDHIRPLPNLDYRIVSGNSLLSVEKNLFNYTLYSELEKKKTQYFGTTSSKNKEAFRREIEGIIGQLTDGKNLFDFEVYFSEVFSTKQGFDVVIANPPYVRMELIKEQKRDFEKLFSAVYTGRSDLYVYFFVLGIRILSTRGVQTLITPNKFLRANYGKKLRKYLLNNTIILRIIDFGDLQIFDATTYPLISIIIKDIKKENNINILEVNTLDEGKYLQSADTIGYHMPQKLLNSDGWQLASPDIRNLNNKLRENGVGLEEYVEKKIFRGVITGLNDAFIINKKHYLYLCNKDPKSAEIIKPYLRGRDVKRWNIEYPGLYIIFTYHGIDISQYPAIKDYLRKFKEKLLARATSKNHEWYELQQPQMGIYQHFSKRKIVYPNICKQPEFSLETTGVYPNQKCFFIPKEDLFLLGILNSKITSFWFKQNLPKLRGGFYEPSLVIFKHFPVPSSTSQQKAEVFKLTNDLLESKEFGKETLILENKLNNTIYQLYNLTEEEIAIVEEQ